MTATPTPDAPREVPRAQTWRLVLAVLVSAAFLYLALGDIHLGDVLRELRQARLLPLLAAVVIATSTFGIRLIRWRILLHDEDGRSLPAGPLWHAVAIGFMANNVLPFRAGEVIRSITAARLTRTRVTSALSSVAVERLFDGVAVVSLLAAGLFFSNLPAGTTVEGVRLTRIATTMGAVFLSCLLVAGLVVAFPAFTERMVKRLVPSERIAGRIVALIEGLVHGLSALQSPSRLIGAIVWSFVLWLVNAASFYVAFSAFQIPVDFAGALVMQGILALAITVPTAPGFVGAFELAIRAVLVLYGVTEGRAVSYALAYHATTFLPITLLGAWSLIRTGLGLRSLQKEATA